MKTLMKPEMMMFLFSSLITLLVLNHVEETRTERSLANIKTTSSFLAESGYDAKFYAELEKVAKENEELNREPTDEERLASLRSESFSALTSR